MTLKKLLLRAILVALVSLFTTSLADVYFADQTVTAAPIYFGAWPFVKFGNITGFLTTGNATNAKGNIVFCTGTAGGPLEESLQWCMQNQPAGIISVFPPVSATVREIYLGRSMYTDLTMPYYQVPEALRQTHIVEIDLADIATLAAMIGSNFTVTMDGSSINAWEEMYEGPLGVIYQVTTAVIAGVGFIASVWLIVRWYKMGMLKAKPELKTYTVFVCAPACLIRCLYNAISPTGLRRMLTAANDFLINTIVLIAVVITLTFSALYWIEAIYKSDLRVSRFISHPATIGILIATSIGWLLYLGGIGITYYFPNASPVGTGLSMLSIIIIQNILLGSCGIIYTFATVVMLIKLSGVKGRGRKEQIYSIFFLGTTALSIWFLFAVTATAFTGYWQQPLVPGVTQIMCSFLQSYIQLLQVISFWRAEKGNVKSHSKPRTNSTSVRRGTVTPTGSTKATHSSSASKELESAVQTNGDSDSQTSDELEEEGSNNV